MVDILQSDVQITYKNNTESRNKLGDFIINLIIDNNIYLGDCNERGLSRESGNNEEKGDRTNDCRS
jgi:hypothetical protein